MNEAAFNDERSESREIRPRTLTLSWKDEHAVIKATDMAPLSEETREVIGFLLHQIDRGGTLVNNVGMPFSVKPRDVSNEVLAQLSYVLTSRSNELLELVLEPEKKDTQSDR